MKSLVTLLSIAVWGIAASAGAQMGPAGLRALSPDRTVLGSCPLEHTSVEIEVSGSLARTRVTHRFTNPYSDPIEAVYSFPLPEDAAVRDMQMRVGDRLVRAEIRRREAARREYEQARASGQTASLLDQERPNIFTTSVANIRPGLPILVTLEYVETLHYEAGHYEMAFPMTIGPRFIPGESTGDRGHGWSPDTDRVPDASRITPPTAPTGRSGHDISLVVHLDAGVPIGAIRSLSHEVAVSSPGPTRSRVQLSLHDSIPNRDFILQWDVSPTQVASGAFTHRGDVDSDGYLMLALHPNAAPPASEITPKEIVFVLDTSGSMYGQPMELSKALMRRLIANLHPQDTFAVLRYSDTQSALSTTPLANTEANRTHALSFIESLEGEGGTDALGGVRAAFAYPRDPSRLRVVVFLTDGYIGNEAEVLGEIQSNIGDARLFSFGVGSSVNRYLLEEMALVGRGDAKIVTLDDNPTAQVDRFYARLQSPYLTDIHVDWGGLPIEGVFPSRMPDLFAGQPLFAFARYSGAASGTIRVRGRLAGRPFEQQLSVSLPEQNEQHSAVASIWARERIAELTRSMYDGENESTVEEITAVALAHRLISQYTSFVAVEHRVIEESEATGPARTVLVPVEMPAGVSPDRIFESSLSLARFQPGDPELRIDAPSDARSVTAVFPFGETHELRFEPRLEVWTTRFLVPRDTAEGNYIITIVITLRNGDQERINQFYTVDGSGPEVELELLDPVAAGAEVRVRARQEFTERDRALHGRRRVQILSDVARLRVTLEDGTPVTLRMIEPGHWEGSFTAPASLAPGDILEIQTTAYDVAGNRAERRMRVEVETP